MASIKKQVVILKPGSEKHLRTELPSSVSSIGEKGAESNDVKTSIDRSVVIAHKESGVVKWFSCKNGYGLATVDSSGKDIFVHRSAFVSPTKREIFYIVNEGDKLEFDIVQRAKRLEAVAVTGPGGKIIPGAPMGVNRIAKKKQTSSLPRKPVESNDAVKTVILGKKKSKQPRGPKDDTEKKAGKDRLKDSDLETKDGEEKSKKQKSRSTPKGQAKEKKMGFLLKKPEVVYERAIEFISVGNNKDALGSLYDFIKDNRRKKWNEAHEKIMLKFVKLCVDSKNVLLAKDGLYHYKNLTQQVKPQSLVIVIEKFMCLAEQKAEEAQKSSIEKIEEVGDLEDTADIPEKVLLAAVTGEVSQDRMDRTVLSPWMRFLWDAYRNLLELLRHNVYIEQLYQQVARRVFSFCVQYQRKGEFRSLCENLRFHLQRLVAAQDMIDPNTKKTPAYLIRLNNPESLMLMLETRLAQMDTAISLDLWMEAFKSALDVHHMINKVEDLVKKKEMRIKPTVYVNFYDKLALVLMKGGNTLYHAAALLQKYCVSKSIKKITTEEIRDVSNRVLLAALSIVSGVNTCSPMAQLLEIEDLQIENAQMLTEMLRLTGKPTHAGILKEICCLNIPNQADDRVRSFFSYLQAEQDPLKVPQQAHEKLKEVVEADGSDYHQYTELILKAVAVKAMKKISFQYESLPLERFSEIIPYYGRFEFERFIVELSKYAFGKFKIDHCNSMILFEPIDETLGLALEQEFDINEPELLGLHKIRHHIESLYCDLENMTSEVFGDDLESTALSNLEQHVEAYKKHMEAEEKLILERRSAIESYKVSNEQSNEAALQERLKHEKAQAEAKHELEALLREEMEQKQAELNEKGAKLSRQQKNFDYSVRALHLEEINLRKKASEERKKLARQEYKKFQMDSVEKAKKMHQKSVVTYEILQKTQESALKFLKEMLKPKSDVETNCTE